MLHFLQLLVLLLFLKEEGLFIWTKDVSLRTMREVGQERWSQGTIIQIVSQSGRDFPKLTLNGAVGAASSLDVRLPPVQVSLNQL